MEYNVENGRPSFQRTKPKSRVFLKRCCPKGSLFTSMKIITKVLQTGREMVCHTVAVSGLSENVPGVLHTTLVSLTKNGYICRRETVQQRFTRLTQGMIAFPYQKRLGRLSLYSLGLARTRENLTKAYKMFTGFGGLDASGMLLLAEKS